MVKHFGEVGVLDLGREITRDGNVKDGPLDRVRETPPGEDEDRDSDLGSMDTSLVTLLFTVELWERGSVRTDLRTGTFWWTTFY